VGLTHSGCVGATYLRDGGNDACVPLSQLVGIQNRPGGEAQSEVKGMTCAQVKTMYTCESALGSVVSVLIKRRCQLRLLRCFENLVEAIAKYRTIPPSRTCVQHLSTHGHLHGQSARLPPFWDYMYRVSSDLKR